MLTQIVLTLANGVVNICNFNSYPRKFIFVLNMLLAFYACCIILYSNALKTTFIMDANSDQTAPTGAVWSGSIWFAV